MGLLIDYLCRDCGLRTEHWVRSPVPPETACPICGGITHRLFGATLLGAARSAAPAPADDPGDDLCLKNSGVPGICHMHPSAARRWSAMARGDTRAVENEIAHQESAIKAGTLTPAAAFGGGHGPAAPAGEAR